MIYHAYYRLIAAVDTTLAVIGCSVWWIIYTRSEGLIRLQFKNFTKGQNLLREIPYYKANLRIIGSEMNEHTKEILLYQLYKSVKKDCQSYDSGSKVGSKDYNGYREVDLQFVRTICMITAMVISALCVVLGLISILTTRKNKLGPRSLVMIILVLNVFIMLGYSSVTVELVMDPRFCSLQTELGPWRFIVASALLFYKPYHIYLIYKYYKEMEITIRRVSTRMPKTSLPNDNRSFGTLYDIDFSTSSEDDLSETDTWNQLIVDHEAEKRANKLGSNDADDDNNGIDRDYHFNKNPSENSKAGVFGADLYRRDNTTDIKRGHDDEKDKTPGAKVRRSERVKNSLASVDEKRFIVVRKDDKKRFNSH